MGPRPRIPPPRHRRDRPHHHHDRRVVIHDVVYPYYPYYPVYLEPLYETTATNIEMERLKADRDRAIGDEAKKLERCIAAAQALVAKTGGAPRVQQVSEKAIAECREKYDRAANEIEARYEIAFSELRKRLLLSRARV